MTDIWANTDDIEDDDPQDYAQAANLAALTDSERAAIASLKRLAKKWPQDLRLASMGGTLVVVRVGDDRFENMDNNAVRRGEAIIDTIHGIPNTGGDW